MDLTGFIRTESLEVIKGVLSTTEIPVDHQWLDYEVLNIALEYGRKDVVKFLLKGNCRVNKTTILSLPLGTPLHNAVKLGDVEIVANLLSRSASISVFNIEGNTPLHLAFTLNQEKIVDVMLDAIATSKDFNNYKNKYGLSHMHIACTKNKTEVIEGYLATAANIKETVQSDSLLWAGFTPLHFSAQFKSLEAFKLLSKHCSKSDFAKQDAKGRTPLQIINAHMQDLQLMSDYAIAENPKIETSSYKIPSYFHIVCSSNNPEAVKRFIEKGAPINTPISADATSYAGFTPLHFAVNYGMDKNVELLLAHGANIECVTREKETPLHLALYKDKRNNENKKRIIDLLYGAVKDKLEDHEDDNGLSYFHIACSRNDIDTVKKYLDKGKDLNIQICGGTNFDGYYSIHFAVLYNSIDVVKLFIERGADINVYDEGRDGTPLHMAFFFAYKELINLLLKHGADAKALRSDDSTMLHLLIDRYVHKVDDELLPFVKRLVLEFGVEVNAKDSKGYTALHHACKKLKPGVTCIKILLEIGADVNLENNKGETAFELTMSVDNQDSKHIADYLALYDHVQNLKALNLEVNPKNEKCCDLLMKAKIQWFDIDKIFSDDKELLDRHLKRLNEVKKLKKAKIDGTALYDLLRMEPKTAITYLQSENLRKLMDSDEFQDCFPIYKYLVRSLLHWFDIDANKSDNSEPAIKRPRSE